MCLIIKDSWERPDIKTEDYVNFVQIAEQDMKVYKYFYENDNALTEETEYSTPYRGFPITGDGDIMTAKKFGVYKRRYYNPKWVTRNSFALFVDAGIHAYTKKPCYWGSRAVITKCIIPKGTPYILGTGDEIVTLQLIVPPLKK
jgi:hypothetical protein